MDVPSPVSPEFTPGSLKLRSWTLSRKQRLVSNTATVSEQSEQLDIVNAHRFSHLSSLLTDSHHPVKCRHHRFLVTIVTTDHRKRHSSGAREATISWKLLSNDPLCWVQHWIIAFLPRTGEIFYIVRLLTFSLLYIKFCSSWHVLIHFLLKFSIVELKETMQCR